MRPRVIWLGAAIATLLVAGLSAIAIFALFKPQPEPEQIAPTNPIIEENKQPGSTAWRLGFELYHISDDVVQQIKGYASATSVNIGGQITFYVSTNPPQHYTLDVFRMGYYGGTGGRLMQHLEADGSTQPTCPEDSDTGLIECNWSPAMSLTVPSTWTSGIYAGLLTNADGYQDYIDFVVRDDDRASDILYQQSVMTYEAYNDYPANGAGRTPQLTGKSLYAFNSSLAPTRSIDHIRATKVSFDRPFSQPRQGTFLNWDIYTVQWLEQNGYDVTYSTDVDTDQHPEALLKHTTFMSAGHDEYWTRGMYDAAVAARDAGINLAFLGADAVYWQARLESSTRGVPDRIVVCYRDLELDPTSDARLKTVKWRDPLLGRPEQTLVGVQYVGGLNPNVPLTVTGTRQSWAYADTGFRDGDEVPPTAPPADGTGAIVGYEADGLDPNYPLPPGKNQQLLSASPFVDNFGQRHVSNASLYTDDTSGALVFASGTMSWSWALARPGYVDARVQRLTSNILDRFTTGALLMSARPSESVVTRGSSIKLIGTVENVHSRPARVLIDIAVVGSDGSIQFQHVYSDQALKPGEQRTFEVQWAVPSNARVGADKLVVAAFGPEWSPTRKWEDWLRDAAPLTVS